MAAGGFFHHASRILRLRDETRPLGRLAAMKRFVGFLFLAWAALAAPVHAQIGGLPPVQVPSTPTLPGAGDIVDGATDRATGLTDRLTDARETQVRDLLRRHRRELEADPNGQPVVRSQILGLGLNAAAIERARAAGFEIVATEALEGEFSLVTLRAPRGMNTRRALRALRESDRQGVYDFDHLHLESGVGSSVFPFAQASASAGGPRVGIIDGGVDGAVAAQRAFAGNAPVVNAHATLVANLIRAASPGARIYAADIYAGVPTGGASSALARALSWLAQENVAVINVSLVGPRNRVVEALVARLVARGFVIVAAVGNDGPAAAPLFPASYDGVVGVTGVDARERVLAEAGRGAQVDFAALGIHGRARGTSFAAPLISARLAVALTSPDPAAAQRVIAGMRTQARDLGRDGRDDVYGYGLIGAPGS